MKLEYVEFLCTNIIYTISGFEKYFKEFKVKYSYSENFTFYLDEELIKIMIRLLQHRENYNFLGNNKLDELLTYMAEIEKISNKRYAYYRSEEYLNKLDEMKQRSSIQGLSCYSFSDSRLQRYELDMDRNSIKLYFYNATLSNDEQGDVCIANVAITFYHITSLKIQGIFDFEYLNSGRCYCHKISRISDTLFNLQLLYEANYEYFIIEFRFTGFFVEDYPEGEMKYKRLLEYYK